MERSQLPYRMNCEGYFLDDNGNILAQDSGHGHIIFPGGGVDDNESVAEGLLREAHEETGVVVAGELEELGVIHIMWGEDWAKTEKQRKRYQRYKGDEMHFFYGKIARLEEPKGDPENPHDDDMWKGERLMPLADAIALIEKNKPFPESTKEYYEKQLDFLNTLKKRLGL